MKVPEHLFESAKHKRMIPFIGAGFSASLKLPTWSQLIDIVSKEIGMDPEVAKLYGDFLQIAEYYHLTHSGIGELRSRLDKLMNSDSIDVSKSQPHMLLPRLKCPAIYTTNWDHWIEKAFEAAGVPYRRIVTIQNILDAAPNVPTIVKYHGDFTSDESLVFTETSYFRRLDFESPLDIRFRSDLLGRVVLFMGYSFTDVNVRYMWFRLTRMLQQMRVNGKEPIAYIVQAKPNPIFERNCKERGIEIIQLNPLDIQGSLVHLLEQIAAVM